ncbi:MAG: hypoxanthine phosphoribosyltransferase [Candidatus Hydrogenedentes bacterium]|nr:hypoxanthine phosphoribosyltransferase [Candidatus Hydrogenedentota bacterium]
MQLREPPLITYNSIQKRVQELAFQISSEISSDNLQVIIVLKGAMFFASDLLKSLPPVSSVDFFKVCSYRGNSSSGEIEVQYLPTDNISGKKVLLIEDILDTGKTTSFILNWLCTQGPQMIRLCVLLKKIKSQTVTHINADYVGFEVEDRFVVGYGMDFNNMYRNLKDIYVLEFD